MKKNHVGAIGFTEKERSITIFLTDHAPNSVKKRLMDICLHFILLHMPVTCEAGLSYRKGIEAFYAYSNYPMDFKLTWFEKLFHRYLLFTLKKSNYPQYSKLENHNMQLCNVAWHLLTFAVNIEVEGRDREYLNNCFRGICKYRNLMEDVMKSKGKGYYKDLWTVEEQNTYKVEQESKRRKAEADAPMISQRRAAIAAQELNSDSARQLSSNQRQFENQAKVVPKSYRLANASRLLN